MRARTDEGTGIGLALAAELVKLHGGRVHAASALGVGTTFTIRIPRGRRHLPDDRIGAPPAAHAPNVTAAILDEAHRWTLPSVEAVADGNAALAAMQRSAPDLVLTDVMMPGLDGFGLLRAIRSDA